MSPSALCKRIQKFAWTGQLGVLPRKGRKRIQFSSVENVATNIVEAGSHLPHGNVSMPVVSHKLDISHAKVWKISRRIYPYNFKPVHQFQAEYSKVLKTFAFQFLARIEVDVSWPWNILWSDEALFSLNRHNCRIWTSQNPHAIQEIHPEKVTVWCGFTAKFIIGPYVFEEITAKGTQICSVKGQRYFDMLKNFVI